MRFKYGFLLKVCRIPLKITLRINQIIELHGIKYHPCVSDRVPVCFLRLFSRYSVSALSRDRMVSTAMNFAIGFFGYPFEGQYQQLITIEADGVSLPLRHRGFEINVAIVQQLSCALQDVIDSSCYEGRND